MRDLLGAARANGMTVDAWFCAACRVLRRAGRASLLRGELLVLSVLLLFALPACRGPADAQVAVDQFDYEWQTTHEKGVRDSATGWVTRPRGEKGNLVVWLTVPALDAMDPAFYLDPASIIAPVPVSASVDGVSFPVSATIPVFALPGQAAGRRMKLELGGPGAGRIDALRFGSEHVLLERVLRTNLPVFFVGLALAVFGAILLLSGVKRGMDRAYLYLGLFAAPCGIATASEASELRMLLVNHHEFWRWTMSCCVCLYPVGYVLLIDRLLPDPRRKILRVLRWVVLGWFLAALLLELLGIFPIHDGRRVTLALALVIVLVSIGIAARRARTDQAARTLLLGTVALIGLSFTGLVAGVVGITGLPTLTHWGLLGFVASLAFIISAQFRQQGFELQRASASLAEKVLSLEAQKQQVESLNTELRHQIAERARALLRLFSTAGERPQRLLDSGEVIDGRYKVLHELGAGAMGQVLAVQRMSDGAPFALKVMTGHTSSSHRARFAREAEIAARLHHVNLVAVHDVSIDASGLLYLVMELVRGGSLEARLATQECEPGWALDRLREICAGLATLHAAGIVHRDLKPANILLENLEGDGVRAKIADFGIARWDEDDPHAMALDETVVPPSTRSVSLLSVPPLSATIDPHGRTFAPDPIPRRSRKNALPAKLKGRVTATHAMIGTPMFMAPELAERGARASFASDIFSLGLVAYEMLTGRFPFLAPPMVLAQAGILEVPSAELIGVPALVNGAILRTLNPDPSRRPSARELLDLLGASAETSAPSIEGSG